MVVFKKKAAGASLVVQWLRLHTSTAGATGSTGSICDWRTKILLACAAQPKKMEKKEKKRKRLLSGGWFREFQ